MNFISKLFRKQKRRFSSKSEWDEWHRKNCGNNDSIAVIEKHVDGSLSCYKCGDWY